MNDSTEMQKLIDTYKNGSWQGRLRALKELRKYKVNKEVQDLIFKTGIVDPAIEVRKLAVGFANDIANTLKMRISGGRPKKYNMARFGSLNAKIIKEDIDRKTASVLLDYKLKSAVIDKNNQILDEFQTFILRFEAIYPKEFDLLSGRMLQKKEMRKFFEPKIRLYSEIINKSIEKYKELEKKASVQTN